MVAAVVTHTGKLYWKIRTSAFSSKSTIDFLNKVLSRYGKGNLKLVWDGASAHRSLELREWLKTLNENKLKLFATPPYSPEFNPVEHLWAEAKRRLGNFVIKNLTELKAGVEQVMQELSQDTDYIEKLALKGISDNCV